MFHLSDYQFKIFCQLFKWTTFSRIPSLWLSSFLWHSHYSKCSFFVQNSILTKLYFYTIFLGKSKLSKIKKLHFHKFFTQKCFDYFSREIKVVKAFWQIFPLKNSKNSREIRAEYLDKNEDFEQHDIVRNEYPDCIFINYFSPDLTYFLLIGVRSRHPT